ncbi:MAG: DJ-1/PfpI family protein [Candidatus Marinimicrobia bacterium]|nr:DJ-1/PfpI family protein [Candidatus Neomarinimicrobiota bacterium]MCF7840586.1 DJ-1/PfpI family protein [Candidatus Neomarinimicrobiota bacterium]
MEKNVLVPLADGFEEIEAITIIDILRRAGAQVITAGLSVRQVRGSHGIKVTADAVLDDVLDKDFDMIVLPGGVPGAPNLALDERVITLIQRLAREQKYTAAICAAPHVLEKAGVTTGQQVTSHPTWADKMTTAIHTGTRVQKAGRVITGQAAGSAMEFAFQLVAELYGEEKVIEVNRGVLGRV